MSVFQKDLTSNTLKLVEGPPSVLGSLIQSPVVLILDFWEQTQL